MDMASRLRACRAQKKLSMAAVAKALELKAWQAVQQWEAGRAKPSRVNLDKLAELYGVPMEYLLHGKALPRSQPAKLGPSTLATSVATQFDALSDAGKLKVLDLLAALSHEEQDTEPTPLLP